MTEPPAPPAPPPGGPLGGPPGGAPPPPPAIPPTGGGTPPSPTGSASGDRTLMIVLSYLYILCLVPLLTQKEDAEIQWHAKQGTVMMGVDFVAMVINFGLSATGLGCVLVPVVALVHLALFVIRIVAVIKGIQGSRLVVPGISQLADSF
ncbi:MAG TPA: hypothetical protein VMV46_13695 [Thermoanaerobaculia bacterium]|nr:hypothetical protein [Thermoanaerobaculia bacterium]